MKKKISIIALSVLVICYLFILNAMAQPWKLLIKVDGQCDHITNSVIGMDSNDIGTWPVVPSMPNFAAEINIMDTNLDEHSEDIRQENSNREVWILDVTVGMPTLLPYPGLDPNVDPNCICFADASQPDFFPELFWDSNEIADIGPDNWLELRLGGANGDVLVSNMMTDTNYMTKESDALATGFYDDANSLARMRYAVVFRGPVEEQRIPLCEGWNRISFSINHCYYEGTSPGVFIPSGVIMKDLGADNDSMEAWLSNDANSPLRDAADPTKAGDWKRVISFDSEGSHIMDADILPKFNTLKYLSAGYGYWIKMNAPGTLVLEGQFLPAGTSMTLQSGWNLIGYIPNDTCYANVDQASICPYTSGVYPTGEGIVYCPVDQPATSVFANIEGQYRRIIAFDCCEGATIYDTDIPPKFNSLQYIGPKYGYWVKIEDPAGAVLTFPGSCPGT